MEPKETAARLAPLKALEGREQTHLLVAEVYLSVQGESTHAGRPCVFVRTAACNLRCGYCDTAWAFSGGEVKSLDEVVGEALGFGVPLVEITGGEPLLQPAVPELCKRLLEAGCEVLVETSGSLSIAPLPAGARAILDLKTPDSGEEAANDYGNLARLRPGDEVKFVVCSRADYEWARDLIRREAISGRATVLLSPVFGRVAPAELVEWMLVDRLEARLNLQLHKFIWPPHQRGV